MTTKMVANMHMHYMWGVSSEICFAISKKKKTIYILCVILCFYDYRQQSACLQPA